MRHSDLAIIFSTAGLTGSDKELRENIWAQTTALLTPSLGKAFNRFEPASEVWEQKIKEPFSVILGRSDPEGFLFFYTTGRKIQEKSVESHLDALMQSFNFGEAFENDHARGFSMSPKAGCEEKVSAHLFWHTGMMCGEVFPDAGIYFAAARQAVIGQALHNEILKDVGHYAIALVRFYDKAQEESQT